jgi:CelD/BcsL family acetyltransferase involved in cellulose biosynthesis
MPQLLSVLATVRPADPVVATPVPVPGPRLGLQFEVLDPSCLSPQAIAAWHDLEERSCHKNPFLSAEFIRSAVAHLGRTAVRLCVVQRAGSHEWLGLVALKPGVVSREIPLPHAKGEDNLYTFRTGLLVDEDHVAEVLDFLFQRLPQVPGMRHGLELPGLRLDSILARELESAAVRCGYAWKTDQVRQVPAVFPDIVTAESLERRWTSSLRKQLRRGRKFLEQFGPVELRLVVDPAEIPPALETFLILERNSWKGAEGTACASNPADETFIREMVSTLAARGEVLMSELRVGDRVAASAINLVAGGRLFAFKIGWDRDLAKGSPGVLHEAELLAQVTGRLRHLTLMDSCALESSYIAGVWPDRIPVATGIVFFTKWARLSRQLYEVGRRMKNRLIGVWQAATRLGVPSRPAAATIPTSSEPKTAPAVTPD